MGNAPHITFVLGGARSGKSAFAEQLVESHEGRLTYIATGQAWDTEMRDRISSHKTRRGERWVTIESPLSAVDAIGTVVEGCILLDCLTLWVTNLMMKTESQRQNFDGEFDSLIAALKNCSVPIVLVSNEVGQGIVPNNQMAREFRDLAGKLHQLVAAAADDVYFVTAGLPQKLK